MKKASFSFNSYPYRFDSHYDGSQWSQHFEELPNLGAEKESQLPPEELHSILQKRNAAGELPLVNYTTQYGLGCFEGLKAYPQKDGSYALFRIDENARRFYRSMEGLYMPPFPQELFISASIELLQKSAKLGYMPKYDPEWEESSFVSAKGTYVRPFSYSESGFGLSLSQFPSVIIVASEVGNYFEIKNMPSMVVSQRTRATNKGTGWIKTAANYVIPILAKSEAISNGFTECLFLDAVHRKYIEECSSCNIFFVLKDGSVITPELNDTVLPGITRYSAIQLLKDKGIGVEERKIEIREVFEKAEECFTTGTAAGISYFGSLEHDGRQKIFGSGEIGPISQDLLHTLKFIQYGLIPDPHNWKLDIPL